MSRLRRRLLVVFVSLTLSLCAALAYGERRARATEAAWTIQLDWDEPGRKYVNRQGLPGVTSAGFREPLWPYEKPASATRVLVLGDSVTYGGGVPYKEIFTWRAQKLLEAQGREVQIVNLSTHGYDVEQIEATLRHRGWAYGPDLVVYANYTNDARRSQVMRSGSAETPIYVGNEPVGWPLGDLLQRHSALFRQARGALALRRLEAEGPDADFDEAFFVEHLAAMKADAEAHGVPLVVFGLVPHVLGAPLERCWTEGRGAGYCRSQLHLHERFLQLTEQQGLVFVSTLPDLQRAGREAYYLNGNTLDPDHPNAEGHAVFARTLARLIAAWMDGELGPDSPMERPEAPARKGKNPPKHPRSQR
ncbi:MAG: SGNH/GDSL hydrolase family protein [Alphaproteobacteria bacterium]|nr:SGNH/GDSL hydrolase family protein [Alphaproteobacteria bacterium]